MIFDNTINKNKDYEIEILKNRLKSLDNEILKRKEKRDSLPEIKNIPKKYEDKFFIPLVEIYLAYSNDLYRMALYSVVCIIEFILKDKFEVDAKKEFKIKETEFISLDKLINYSDKIKFIDKKEFNFLMGIKLVRNESIHDLSEVKESEFRIAYQVLITILQKC